MRNLLLLMHVSLDGFVAGPNGEMDWIAYDAELERHSKQIFSTVDTTVFGRATYQGMESYWPTIPAHPESSPHELEHSRWLDAATKVVFSRSLQAVTWENTRLVHERVPETIAELKRQPGGDMVIIGSASIAHACMQAGLIDHYWINVNPIVLGNGIPLFKDIPSTFRLRLLATTQFAIGVVGLHYQLA